MDVSSGSHLPFSLLHGVLDPGECSAAIQRAEQAGFESMARRYPPGYRNNDRVVFDDSDLAARIFVRLTGRLPARVFQAGVAWDVVGLNERFRCCRYRDGQAFCIHRDGPHVRSADERSLWTLMIYLDDATGFSGGATRFYASGPAASPPLGEIVPALGAAALFSHAAWHDGAPVTAGIKHVLRTDVMVRRAPDQNPVARDEGSLVESARTMTHLGYVWGVASGRTLWSVGRDGAAIEYDDSLRVRRIHRVGTGSLTAIAIDHNGAVVVGDREGRLHRVSGDEPAIQAHDGAVTSLAVQRGKLVSAGADGRVLAWPTHGGAPAQRARHDGWVRAITCVGGRIASGGDDGVVCLDGREIAKSRSSIRSLAACGTDWLAGTAAGALIGAHGREWPELHTGAITAIACAGNRVVTGGEDGCVRVADTRALDVALAIGHHEDFVTAIAVLDEHRCATASYDGTVRIWILPRGHGQGHGRGHGGARPLTGSGS